MAPAMALAVRANGFLETLQKRWKTYRFYFHLGANINKIIRKRYKTNRNATFHIIT